MHSVSRRLALVSDRRIEKRDMCSDLIEIRFEDQTGRQVIETGLVEDVSPAGLCVSLNLPVTAGCLVEFAAEGFSGRARVRYCELGDYSYLLGMEFSDGFRWDRQKWQPKHLLRLPQENR